MITQSTTIFLLALTLSLGGCVTAPHIAKPSITTQPSMHEIAISKPWSTHAIVTSQGETRIAATSHTDGLLEVWQVTPQRDLQRLAQDDRVGFHPDGVRWINETDLAVAAEGKALVQRWHYENGKLELLQSVGVSDPPMDITPVDLDHDGHLDFVLGPYNGKRVTLLWGQPDGQFRQEYLSSSVTPSYPRLIDWNRDGKTDIVWSDWSVGSLRLARNMGGKTFDVQLLRPAAPGAPRQVAVGDLDNDGYPDLVMAMETAKCARLIFNDKNGGIAGEVEIPAPISGYSAAAITQNKGAPLLALSEEGMIVLARPGPGGPRGTWQLRKLPAGSLPLDLQFIDLDGDGELDLLFANSGSNTVQVVFGPLWENATALP